MIRFWGLVGFLSTMVWATGAIIPRAGAFFGQHLGPDNDRWFLVVGLVAMLVSSFFAWNEKQNELDKQHDELQRYANPKLILAFEPREPYLHIPRTDTGTRVIYVRTLATTNSRVNHCQARISAIYRWGDGRWDLTAFNIPKELAWSEIHERGDREATLLLNEDRYIDVVKICEPENIIHVAVFEGRPPLRADAERIPILAMRMFYDANARDIFRFDVRVFGEPFADGQIRIAIQRGEQWDKMRAQLLGEQEPYSPRLEEGGQLAMP